MKYWLVVGRTNFDNLVVVCEILRIKDSIAFFESADGDLVLALNQILWSSIRPITVDEYFTSHIPEIRQKVVK